MERTVLVIEDEKNIARWVRTYFEQAGYRVVLAGDGAVGLELVQTLRPDLLILDLNLPKLDGLTVCRAVREHPEAGIANTLIIMLTARVEEVDRLKGLELGADDYVTKPFSPKELVARARAMFRRIERGSDPARQLLKDGALLVDVSGHRATRAGVPLELTPNEFAVLVALLGHRGQVLSRSQLIELALGHDYEGQERTVDVYVRHLRRKLGDDQAETPRIATVFGVGYRYD
ncbi:MAG: response regulator transcription factor [Anaerolineae bacterium]|nr:response regulator transcription factor [Anaerolineae bacterium]